MRRYISIVQDAEGEMLKDVRRLASIGGSEDDEIDLMVESDRMFVAKKKGKIIGFIALRSNEDSSLLEISGLAVEKKERRRGLASVLLRNAEEFAAKIEVPRVVARTSNDNIPALAFYQRNGFIVKEVKLGALISHHGGKKISGWAGIPVRDEIVLEKNLSPE